MFKYNPESSFSWIDFGNASRQEREWNISRQIEYYEIRHDQMISGIIYGLCNWFMLMTVKFIGKGSERQIANRANHCDMKLVFVGCQLNDQWLLASQITNNEYANSYEDADKREKSLEAFTIRLLCVA